ncbi:MAG: TlpA family protein disulfide reductase [Bacteriovoracaceae bacterium]|nr:TlpA family protein disulfide reductase [Bacteriovoracaceae bacterium]
MVLSWKKTPFILLLWMAFLFGPGPGLARASDATWHLLAQTFTNILDQEAPTFSLPDLQGKNHHLADQQGKWTLLFFWASWCGVCQQTLPSVEKLHQALPGLTIWGINLDQGNALAIQNSVQQHGLTFTTLNDAQGVAAKPYNASAIPVAFLISPQLKLVAAVAGGFSWDQPNVVQNLQKIITAKTLDDPPEELTNTRPSLPGKPLPLPELSLSFSPPQTFSVFITWPIAAMQYRIKVPRLELPPEIKILNVAARPQTGGLTYLYELAIPAGKDYFIGPVTLSFTDALGRSEQSSRHPGIKVQAVNRASPKNQMLLWGSILFALLIVVGGGIVVYRRKKAKIGPASSTITDNGQQEWMKAVAELKIWQRLHDPAEYAAYLLTLEQTYQIFQGIKDASLTRLLNDVRYGGRKLTDAEIAYHEKILQSAYQNEQNRRNEEK